MTRIREQTLLLAVSVMLTLFLNGCSPEHYRTVSNCSECHQTSMSCHIKKKIDMKILRKLWEESFHKSLLKESFTDCPYLGCIRCHPDLDAF